MKAIIAIVLYLAVIFAIGCVIAKVTKAEPDVKHPDDK